MSSVETAAALTATSSVADWVIEPSVTVTWAVSTFFSFIEPLLPDETVATPLVNVIVVDEPKLVAEPVLSVTVGCDAFGELAAPPKVRLWSPV
jgi:hypothetical protein